MKKKRLNTRVLKWVTYPMDGVCSSRNCLETGRRTDAGIFCLYCYMRLGACSFTGCSGVSVPGDKRCRIHYIHDKDWGESEEYLAAERERIVSPKCSLGDAQDYAFSAITIKPRQLANRKRNKKGHLLKKVQGEK